MARHSSVSSPGAAMVDDILGKWRSGQYTIEQLQQICGGKISWSALQRFLHRADELYRENRRLEDQAAVWCAKVDDGVNGDVGQLCRKMLRILAHAKISKLSSEAGGEVEARDLAALARTLRDLEQADSIWAETKHGGRSSGGTDQGGTGGGTIDGSTLARVKELVRGRLN